MGSDFVVPSLVYFTLRLTFLNWSFIASLAVSAAFASANAAPSITFLAGTEDSGKAQVFMALNVVDANAIVINAEKVGGEFSDERLLEAAKIGRDIIIETDLSQPELLRKMRTGILQIGRQYDGNLNLFFVFKDRHLAGQNSEAHNLAMQNFEDVRKDFDRTFAVDNSQEVKSLIYVEHNQSGRREQIGTSLPLSKMSTSSFDRLTSLAKKRPSNKGYDLFFDLDWTLFYGVENPREVEADRLLTFREGSNTSHFRALDHAQWMLESLLSLPGVRVHFITGADRRRAEWLLSQIKVGNRTALAAATTLITKDQLLETSRDEKMKFTKRFGKYIQRWRLQVDMTRAILIDDSVAFARFGLTVLNSYGRYNFRQSYSAERNGQAYEPLNEAEFRAERNRAFLIYNLLANAIEADRRAEGVFTQEAVRPVLLSDGSWREASDPKLARFLNKPSTESINRRMCEMMFINL